MCIAFLTTTCKHAGILGLVQRWAYIVWHSCFLLRHVCMSFAFCSLSVWWKRLPVYKCICRFYLQWDFFHFWMYSIHQPDMLYTLTLPKADCLLQVHLWTPTFHQWYWTWFPQLCYLVFMWKSTNQPYMRSLFGKWCSLPVRTLFIIVKRVSILFQ